MKANIFTNLDYSKYAIVFEDGMVYVNFPSDPRFALITQSILVARDGVTVQRMPILPADFEQNLFAGAVYGRHHFNPRRYFSSGRYCFENELDTVFKAEISGQLHVQILTSTLKLQLVTMDLLETAVDGWEHVWVPSHVLRLQKVLELFFRKKLTYADLKRAHAGAVIWQVTTGGKCEGVDYYYKGFVCSSSEEGARTYEYVRLADARILILEASIVVTEYPII